MGKVVQVKASVNTVRLPPRDLPYIAGETTTLTDAEYSGLTSTQKNSVVVVKSGVADPLRFFNPGSSGEFRRLLPHGEAVRQFSYPSPGNPQ
jgi:hypothetical protein